MMLHKYRTQFTDLELSRTATLAGTAEKKTPDDHMYLDPDYNDKNTLPS